MHRQHLIGIAMPDGHVRITKADGYTLAGGTEQQHEEMQEKAAKISEELDKAGPIQDPRQLKDIIERVNK